ncbi:MAG TPA: glycosyltransferase family 2 protein, partial [Gammaproteobacteria bacterium]|nr:glycosyltransferase family 2 protein [Gammaproteobacteria bacterium]
MRCELSEENLTVAMITRNEEQAIVKVIQDIRNVVPHAEIFVVDSSQDQTAQLAEKSGARVIKQYPPEGYGPAMYKALTSATGHVIVTLDCDNTYPAEKIPELAYSILKDNYDLVDASRLKNKPAAMPWINYLGNI